MNDRVVSLNSLSFDWRFYRIKDMPVYMNHEHRPIVQIIYLFI